jgi:hypothetical protein
MACAMQLVLNPWQFDVILTTNLFGDILSDEMAGHGLLPQTDLWLPDDGGGHGPDRLYQCRGLGAPHVHRGYELEAGPSEDFRANQLCAPDFIVSGHQHESTTRNITRPLLTSHHEESQSHRNLVYNRQPASVRRGDA